MNAYQAGVGYKSIVLNPDGGTVGINTTSAAFQLDVAPGTASATLRVGSWAIVENVTTTQAMFGRNVAYATSIGAGWRNINTGGATAIRMYDDPGDPSIAFHLHASETAGTSLTSWDSTDVKMTIRNSGDVGIGTTTPVSLLHMYSSNGARFRIQSTATTYSLIDFVNNTTARWSIGIDNTQTFGKLENRVLGTDAIRFYDSSNNVVLTPSSGSVLINTTTLWNNEKLGIQISNSNNWANVPAMIRLTNLGSGYISKITFTDSSIIDGWIGMVPITGGSYFAMGFSGYTEQGFKLYQNGNYQFVGTNLSDRRIKSNIQVLDNSLEKVSRLKPSTFSYNDNPTAIRGGFIAQEVKEVFPEFVSKPQHENEMMGVDYNGMIAVLTKAIQEQQTLIQSLQEKLERNNIL